MIDRIHIQTFYMIIRMQYVIKMIEGKAGNMGVNAGAGRLGKARISLEK